MPASTTRRTTTNAAHRSTKHHPARTGLAVVAIAAFAAGAPAWSFQYVGRSSGGTAAVPRSTSVPVNSPTASTANGVTTQSVETGADPASTPRGVLATPSSVARAINANSNDAYGYPTTPDEYPVSPTPSASMPIRATPDIVSSGDAADRLRTGPVSAAADRSTTTPTLTPDSSRQPLDCRTAGGRSIPCSPR